MDEISLRRLRYFLAVAELQHFGKAAVRLYISQPALSAEIKRLETDLGVTLFQRTSRSVRLTAQGVILQRDALDLLARAAELQRNVRASTAVSGRLRVGFVNTMLYRGLPAVAESFAGRYPEVDLGLIEMNSAEQATQLRGGAIDLIIGHDARMAKDVVSTLLVDDQFVACLPAAHRLARRRRLQVGQLAGESLIVFRREISPHYHDTVVALCVTAGFSPTVAHQVTVWQSAIALVRAGLGVAIVPSPHSRLAMHQGTTPSVSFIPLADAAISSKTFASYQGGNRSAGLAEEFIADLARSLQPPAHR